MNIKEMGKKMYHFGENDIYFTYIETYKKECLIAL